MSQQIVQDDGLLVIDDVLPPSAFQALSREVELGDYRWVHTEKWNKSWRLFDGNPLRGTSVYFDPAGAFGWTGPTYPTATTVDALIDAVRNAAATNPGIAGLEGVDWIALYLSPWIYPVGSSIALHQDAGSYSGSFTFFAHARWGSHWGGELVVSRANGPITKDDWMNDDQLDLGIGTFVAPRPNRLVLLADNRPHRINRVDRNAGTHVRASIAGFFLRAR